tara:strand:- start:17591 stop:17830 length:240 start_codon:yes stop_codon:yes gene_type:complete
MREITVIYDNITLVLRGQYFEGCEGTYIDAPEPTEFHIYSVYCGKQDIIDLLDEDTLNDLEEKAVERMKEEEEQYDSLI